MRSSRLIHLMLLLQQRQRLTAAQLAAELEVSVRTVYRDVAALVAAGVPVVGDSGSDGGYRLIDGYRTRLTGLNDDEAAALIFAAVPWAASDLGIATTAAVAGRKLVAALPRAGQDQATRRAERFYIDGPTWYQEQDQTPHLAPPLEPCGTRAP